MVDKIKPLKLETDTDGSDLDFLPTEADPSEDYASVKGISLENSDSTLMFGDSGIIKFKDSEVTTAMKLKQLMTALNNIFDNSTNGFTATNVQAAIEEAKEITGDTDIVVSFNDANSPYVDVLSSSYEVVGEFVFKGTSIIGNPNYIKVIAGSNDAVKKIGVRIYDRTNAEVICENASIVSVDRIVHDLGTISNVPTSNAVFEVQAKVVDNGAKASISSTLVGF